MSGLHGVKETKEVLQAVNMVAEFVINRVKNGVGADDALALVEALVQEGPFKAALAVAVEDIGKVGSEIKDMDVSEVLELATLQIGWVPRLVDALKGSPVVNPVQGDAA